jgi:hypothetical protein
MSFNTNMKWRSLKIDVDLQTTGIRSRFDIGPTFYCQNILYIFN